MDKAASWLREALDYEFSDAGLLTRALTHRSAGGSNNERLEFLGDAVLAIVISEAVFHRRPSASEGTLSRLRASLVKEPTLADLAKSLGLGDHLLLGPGERKSGVHRRASVLSDSLEALFGAVYVDAGFEEARRFILQTYTDRLDNLPETDDLKDPKSRLQEFAQARKWALPAYRVEQVRGEAHQKTFEVSCSIGEIGESTGGVGSSRRDAEQDAAQKMLEHLDEAS